MFLEISQNLQENICARVSFLIKLQVLAYNFIEKETLAHVFSYEFCEISKNTFFIEHLWATASDKYFYILFSIQINGIEQKWRHTNSQDYPSGF